MGGRMAQPTADGRRNPDGAVRQKASYQERLHQQDRPGKRTKVLVASCDQLAVTCARSAVGL